MIIKVCGMRDAQNIRELDETKLIDWMGFIFFPKSSRNVTLIPDYLPHNCKRVGVFVNEDSNTIQKCWEYFGLSIIQLHGHETPDYCKELRQLLPSSTQFVKMVQISSIDDMKNIDAYEGIVDYFLFETKCDSYGGSGQQFDWGILQEYKGNTPFILTGGIGPEDADKVKAFSHTQFAGIDLNSKFETAPALKDIELLKNFIKQLR